MDNNTHTHTHTQREREREREILRFYHRERVVFSSSKFREKFTSYASSTASSSSSSALSLLKPSAASQFEGGSCSSLPFVTPSPLFRRRLPCRCRRRRRFLRTIYIQPSRGTSLSASSWALGPRDHFSVTEQRPTKETSFSGDSLSILVVVVVIFVAVSRRRS